MDEIIKVLQQVSADVWKNYKHHAQAFDPKEPDKFWENWTDDVNVFDAAYKDDPVRMALFVYLAKGLAEATKEGLRYGNCK